MEIPLRLALLILVARQPVFQSQQILRLEAGIDAQQFVEAADEQSSADQQQQRQRDLRHDERAAHAIPLCAIAAAAPALFQHRVQFGPRELNGRSQPKQPARHYRHRQREEQHARINLTSSPRTKFCGNLRNAASPQCASKP